MADDPLKLVFSIMDSWGWDPRLTFTGFKMLINVVSR